MLYPSICNAVFAAFECRELIANYPVSVLEADDRLLCNEDKIRLIRALSVAVVIIVAVGVPVGFGTTLVKHAHQFSRNSDALSAAIARELAFEFEVSERVSNYVVRDVTSMGRSYSFLLDAYTFDHYYWEVLDLLRKLLLRP